GRGDFGKLRAGGRGQTAELIPPLPKASIRVGIEADRRVVDELDAAAANVVDGRDHADLVLLEQFRHRPTAAADDIDRMQDVSAGDLVVERLPFRVAERCEAAS